MWLGVVASGLGYFMWNYGATQVDARHAGIMNNVRQYMSCWLTLPSWEQPHWPRLLLAGALVILARYWVHRRGRPAPHSRTSDR